MRSHQQLLVLFLAGAALSQAYINLRDRDADEYFLEEVRRGFHARFREMYLTRALLEVAQKRDYRIQCPKPGPAISGSRR
jgi:hypothetical protein